MSQSVKVSICIASHNMKHLIGETLDSCYLQNYHNLEIIVLDDASTDGTKEYLDKLHHIKYFRSEEPSGTGGAFNKAISQATGDIIVLLCADDVFTDRNVISDIVNLFTIYKSVGHVSRYYHQFIDGDRRPVRAWRTDDIIELANNPSGMAFRRSALKEFIINENGEPIESIKKLSNNMFVEVSTLVNSVLEDNWNYKILKYDAIAVRIHQSISQNKNYYLKMWKSSPVEEWYKVGGAALCKDYTSLIQIKNNFKTSAVFQECINFVRLRPANLINLGFWAFAIVALLTPRVILRRVPDLYRRTWGRLTTREMKRP